MITWGDVVELIVCVFDIKQTQLAERMNCDKSAITRIKKGEYAQSLENDKLFSRVFDPATPDSPANKGGGNPQFWLRLIKEEIESKFKEVREAMEDCWNESDYQTFVLVLLERARPGPPSKKNSLSSTDCDRSSETPDIDSDGDCHKKQEEASLSETPSEQMSKIFEQAVADYNIAFYVCKLPDYLIGEPFYEGDIFTFLDTIQVNVLAKYINHQSENIFRKISEFNIALKSYSGFLGMIRLSVSEKYGAMLKIGGYNNEIIGLIDSEYDEVKNNLDRKREVSIEGGGVNGLSISELEGKINQLEFLRSILSSHKQLCELFGEVCPGKTLLVFQ